MVYSNVLKSESHHAVLKKSAQALESAQAFFSSFHSTCRPGLLVWEMLETIWPVEKKQGSSVGGPCFHAPIGNPVAVF